MEKAKLLVWISKKGKVVVELEFKDGKKITLPWNPKDTKLNNTEVAVKRENGKPILVEANGNTLFSVNQPKSPSGFTPKHKETIKPNTSNERIFSSKKPDEQSAPTNKETPSFKQPDKQNIPTYNAHVDRVQLPAFAPYNFIPLNEKIVSNTVPISNLKMNKYDINRNTGWIELIIEAITPLYIRGTLTKSEVEQEIDSKNKSGFFAPVKRISIPGSSLRGMTRNMVEIVSFSKFEFFEDRRLYYRGLADQSNLREEYQNKMASFDRQKRRSQYNFSAGILRKSIGSGKQGLHFEIKSSGNGFKQILKSDAKNLVGKLNQKYEEFRFYKLQEGFLVVSGNAPKKKRDWLINYPPDNVEPILIPEEDIKNYKQDRTRSEQVPDILEQARRGEEVPCFFVQWKDKEGGNRISFGHTGMFRLAYEKTIRNHIQQHFDFNNKLIEDGDSKIDFTEAIFGNEKTHSGRVFFEDAFLIGEQTIPLLNVESPKILSSPKPTTFQQYLVQNSTERKQLSHYNSNSSIRGYKYYWHKSGEKKKWAQTDEKINPKLYTTIQPVKPGTQFRSKIRFENLSDEELGALLFALDLPEGFGHKLGMGKPLGLGSISVIPTLYLSNIKKRYTDFFAEWHNDIPVSNELKGKKQIFEQYLLNELNEGDKTSLWQVSRLQELLVMLHYDSGKKLEEDGKTRYLTIEPQNEFKNRSVLPKATALVSTSVIDKTLLDVKNQTFEKRQNTNPTLEKKISYIKNIHIKGLWDKFDFIWPLDKTVNVLVGANGKGKTTILKLIESALKQEYNRHYFLQNFIITFDNDEELYYLSTDKKSKSFSSRLIIESVSTLDTKAVFEQENFEQTNREISQIYDKELTNELLRCIRHLRTERVSLISSGVDFDQFINQFIEIINNAFKNTKKCIEFVGEFVLDEQLLTNIRQDTAIPKEVYNKIEAIKNEIEKEETTQKEHIFLGWKYFEILENKMNRDNILRYKSFILKHASFDAQNTLPSKIIVRLSSGEGLLVEQLSSGEKQLMLILLKVLILKIQSLTNEDKCCVLIMDEPEISLHLEWQEKLINNILSLNENIQIIIATHSPGIIQDGWLGSTTEIDSVLGEHKHE